jgi:DNA-binding LytR/AlgR family response regulator
MNRPTALIADDEPLLRDHLQAHLARLWPELEIVGHARNGREAVEMFEHEQPQIVFLDVHMPGTNGLEAARAIQATSGRRATIVFVTAYEQYAVKAFEQGAIDYLVKPFEELRLADTVQRLKERLASAAAPAPVGGDTGSVAAQAGADASERIEAVLDRLATQLRHQASGKPWLQWIKASVGTAVRLIPVEQVAYLRSDEKYTLVVWEGGEALIRKPIRELIDELDPELFVQVHRSVIVNLRHVAQVTRGPNETADVQLKGRNETLPVSRSYLHLFRQM